MRKKVKAKDIQFTEYNAAVMDFLMKSMVIYSFSYMLKMMPPKKQMEILQDIVEVALEKTKILYGDIKSWKDYEYDFKQEFYKLFGIEYKGV